MQNILKVKSCLTWSTLDERKNCMSKKSNCKRKNQFGKWFPEMWACASFYIWSGSRVLLSFWGGFAKYPSNPAPKAKKTYISAEERVVLSLQCSMCANFAFFVGLFLKGMRAIMGNSFLGTHCHHSGSHTTSWSHFCAGKASRQRAMGYILPLAQSADFYPRHSTKQKFKDPPIFTFTPNTSQSVDAKRNWPLWEEKQPQLNSQFTPGEMANIQ